MPVKKFKNFSSISLKASLLSLLSFSIPSSVLAHSPFDCFYVGLGIGESITSSRLNLTADAVTVFATPSTSTASVTADEYLKRNSILGDVYAGYGFSCNCIYLGGEVSLKISNQDGSNTSTAAFSNSAVPNSGTLSGATTVHLRKVEWALDARPGILLSPNNVLYGRIGAAFNRISLFSNLNATIINGAVAGGAPVSFGLGPSTSKNVVGLRLGLGMEQQIFDNVSLRVDYVYTHFKKIEQGISLSGSVAIPGGTLVAANFLAAEKARTVCHAVLLGISYYFF